MIAAAGAEAHGGLDSPDHGPQGLGARLVVTFLFAKGVVVVYTVKCVWKGCEYENT